MGLLGGIGEAIGGLLGGGGDDEQARKAYEAALAAYQDLRPEDLATLLGASQSGPSAFESQDPTAMRAQLDALSHLQGVYQQGGMTMQDRVAQEQAIQRSAQYEQAQRGAIMQDMAARGQLGGGAELAAKLAAAQGGAANAYSAGSSAAAAAQRRALEAMTQAGGLGGQITGLQNQQAAARDAMARFNASQRMGAYGMNWGQQMDKARGVAGVNQGLGDYYTGAADRGRRQWGAIGGSLGSAADAGVSAIGAAAGGAGGGGGGGVPYNLASPDVMPNKKNWWEG